MLQAILSSIIIVALQGMFMKIKDVKKYYQLSLPDMVGRFLFSYNQIFNLFNSSYGL